MAANSNSRFPRSYLLSSVPAGGHCRTTGNLFSEFKVQSSGFKVWGSKFGVQSLLRFFFTFTVRGSEFSILPLISPHPATSQRACEAPPNDPAPWPRRYQQPPEWFA